MVARGAGAAGPVLLACRQWDPLWLARRLPSLGVGAWRSAPLLPLRVQCPVRVCAALAAGSGGWGRYLVLCLSRSPHPAPRVRRCVWRAVPSGCPLPSLAGTPFHAVCAFRVLGLVALLVVPACPLGLCALALPRRPLPPPLAAVPRAPRAVPALGAGRAVPRGPCPSAYPALVPCSVWRAWGGAVRFRFPPTWLFLRGAPEVGRPPSPDCPPTGRAVGVRYPCAVGAGVLVWGPNTVPLACMPCGGCVPRGLCGVGASPGGGWPDTVVRGVWCQALSLPRPPVLWAGCRGPLPTGCGCGGGCGRGDPSPTPQSALLRAGFARCGGDRRAPGGGAPPAWVWGVQGPALSHPRVPALSPGCRGPVPTGCGCGGVRAWGPVTNSTARALACCGGGMRLPGGGSLPGCGASRVGRSPTPECPPSGRAAGTHYPLAVGAGGCGRGDPSPTPQRTLLRAGFARCGGSTRAPGGGASCLGVGRPGSGALPLPTARPLGGLPGPTTHWLWVRGGAGVGTRHQPHSARSCELALRAVGAAWRCPRGAPLAWVWGVRGRALSHPRLPALWAGCRGPLPTGCGYGGVQAWGPVTNPTARALASWLCTLWGRHKGDRVGRLLPGCGASGVGRSPTPDCPPSGRAAGAHYPLAVGAGGCGRWDPSATPQRALLRAGFARCGGDMRVPGGAHLAWVWGVRGRALPHPRLPALWAGARGPLPTGCGCGGGAGVGTCHKPHSARSCELALRAVGATRGRPGGGRLLPWCGASGVGRSPDPDCPPSGRAAGAHYPLAVGAGGCGRGDPSPAPQRALLRAGFARCGGGMRFPGGGASCLGVGRPGSGALPTPTARPLGGLPGPTTHWLWVRGGAGVRTRHQPHSARSFELALRAVGAA